jgi:SAM-dependent methyltransferase
MIFICPRCRGRLTASGENQFRCPNDALVFSCVDGVWRFLLPERQSYYSTFISEYEAIRRFEGRFSMDAAYYRALPFEDLSGNFSGDWRIRSASFRALMGLLPVHSTLLDLGAGNGWLANRLASAGHEVYAVDLLLNPEDGLGTWKYYESKYTPVQAEFIRLPFLDASADVVLYNASFHYSESYGATLAEASRVLKHGGQIIIMDSPVYRDTCSGEEMLAEKEVSFLDQYGFASNSIESEGYLTYDHMQTMGGGVGLRWRHVIPFYGLLWTLRPWLAGLRRKREPAQFGLWIGSRS